MHFEPSLLTNQTLIDAAIARLTAEEELRENCTQLARYKPYPKQLQFHANGHTAQERLLLAANRVGKTHCGAAESAFHLSGQYPAWWPGRRFEGPVELWAGSDTGETTRDTVQAALIGPPSVDAEWGTAALPADTLGRITRRMGVADALDTVEVKHVSGGSSVLGFKSYDQGRKKWQGTMKNCVWCDEEPPYDVYIEALTRTNILPEGGRGLIYITFTPLMGWSKVVESFLSENAAT